MTARGSLRWLPAACAICLLAWACQAQVAEGKTLPCASTSSSTTQASTAPGRPCWVDVNPYPFGSDGNPVDPSSAFCTGDEGDVGPAYYGPNWLGDFANSGYGVPGDPACYQQVTSLAFRAWNRGLAATSIVGGGVDAFGVWLFNGTGWYPDPTFPGSNVCPGNTILWAGKLDYWLIGSPSAAGTTLCHFDGINLVWEPLTLPAATTDRLPLSSAGLHQGGVTSGTCFAWDNCWFFGTNGIEVHWDGQELSDESGALGDSPWLQGDFTGAASTGQTGLAVSSGQFSVPGTTPQPLPSAPDGTAAPQLFTSNGAAWSPLAISLPADPGGTSLVAAAEDSAGDTWLAAGVASATPPSSPEPVPLMRVTAGGTQTSCAGYAAGTFTYQNGLGYRWMSLAVAPDGSALAGGTVMPGVSYLPVTGSDLEPVLVQAACGKAPAVTEFRIPDPLYADQPTAPPVPADEGASTGGVAASAGNDAWAASGAGLWSDYTTNPNHPVGGLQRPHLYQYTDGQTPTAPAGDDKETRPSLFTLSPPVYQVSSSTVVVKATTRKVTKKSKPKTVRLPPAVYDVRTRLGHVGKGFVLRLTFKLRRPATLGLAVLHGKRIVARTGLKRFTRHSGELSVRISRSAWPTGLKLLTPPVSKKAH